MFSKKQIVVVVIVFCLAQGYLSKPVAEDGITEGRGVGSALWGWLSYPFSWLTSEPEALPIHEQLISSTSKYQTQESVQIASHIIWCNDQTCTTQTCDEYGCRNKTCNIYDTNMTGECKKINITPTPEEPKPTEPIPKPSIEDKVPGVPSAPAVTSTTAATTTLSSTPKNGLTTTVKGSLELEDFLSMSVGSKQVADNKGNPIASE